MADLLKPGALDLFLFFVVPGFVSLTVYDLLVPSARRNLSESAIQLVSFSMFNIACWYWGISLMAETRMRESHAAEYYLLMFGIIVISPSLLAIGTYRLRTSEGLRRFVIHPSPTPWDFLFSQRRVFWILFHLKSGQRLGGYYATNSFTSRFRMQKRFTSSVSGELMRAAVFASLFQIQPERSFGRTNVISSNCLR